MKVRINNQKFNDGLPAAWLGGDRLMSHIFSALSLLFPDGERFFIRSVKFFADRAPDEKMRKEIKAFIGQETQHGLAHDRFNQALAKSLGNSTWFVDFFKFTMFDTVEAGLKSFDTKNQWGEKVALAATAAAENMTAGFAEMFFNNPALSVGVDPEVRELFNWHAAEELEHRALAYDLLQTVDDTYRMRIMGAIFAYSMALLLVSVGTTYFAATDKNFRISELPGSIWRLFSTEDSLGRVAVRGFFDYLRPDFHPEDNPHSPAAAEYLAKIA